MEWSLSCVSRQGGHPTTAEYSGIQADCWFFFLYRTLSLSYTTSNIRSTSLDVFAPIAYTLIQLDIWHTPSNRKVRQAEYGGQKAGVWWAWGWITGELVHGSEWITRHGSPNPIISLLLQWGLKFMSAHAASSLGGGCHSSSGCHRTGQAGPRGTRLCLISHQLVQWEP